MSSFVTDTHAILWYLSENPELSGTAREIFESTDTGQAEIFIPSIVLAEIVYLTERHKVPANLIDRIANLPDIEGSHYHAVVLDTQVIQAMRRIPRETVREMPDRIIAATALYLGLPLITRDSQITQLGEIQCIW